MLSADLRGTLCWQGLEILSDYDYVAIFDADFKPDPEFLVRRSSCDLVEFIDCCVSLCGKPSCLFAGLRRPWPFLPPCSLAAPVFVQMQTVPYLVDNPEVGYVQARWVFANPDESYLTKVAPHACQLQSLVLSFCSLG